jgi:hypothetical protein
VQISFARKPVYRKIGDQSCVGKSLVQLRGSVIAPADPDQRQKFAARCG